MNPLPRQSEFPDLEQVESDLAKWASDGSQPWNLPASAVHFVLGCHGAESNPVGTAETLEALTEECEECCGEGYFQDDSHPGNPQFTCETCRGHGRVSLRAKARRAGR